MKPHVPTLSPTQLEPRDDCAARVSRAREEAVRECADLTYELFLLGFTAGDMRGALLRSYGLLRIK